METTNVPTTTLPSDPALTAPQIESMLVKLVAQMVSMPESEIDPAISFFDYGLDSHQTVALAAELEDKLGRRIEEPVLWDYPTIRALSGYLARRAET